MPLDRRSAALAHEVAQVEASGTAKGHEKVVTDVIPASGERGPRYRLEGFGEREFIRMNSNSFLGMTHREELKSAADAAARRYGAGPGGVRFICGTCQVHAELEESLARFHGREACMLTSSAYTTVLGSMFCLTTPETGIISDALNHNSIINSVRWSHPKLRKVYPHADVNALERLIQECEGQVEGLIVVTDGIFSMRGTVAPLKEIGEVVARHDERFPQNIILIVDDSHGVGGFGATGRGSEEYCGAGASDLLIGTLGKAFGVNGGYVVSSRAVISFLRERNPLYIYTNPITPAESAAALASVRLVDSPVGAGLLKRLRERIAPFRQGLKDLGYESLDSEHPVVPLFVRDTEKTTALVKFLLDHDILATGLNFPIVPKGDQLVRFQVSAEHTRSDIDTVLDVLRKFKTQH